VGEGVCRLEEGGLRSIFFRFSGEGGGGGRTGTLRGDRGDRVSRSRRGVNAKCKNFAWGVLG
jgi:hypothetical protein